MRPDRNPECTYIPISNMGKFHAFMIKRWTQFGIAFIAVFYIFYIILKLLGESGIVFSWFDTHNVEGNI